MPPQHGAWAFLALPLAVGLTVAPWTPVLAVLAITWVAAYPTSYFLLAMLAETGRRRPRPRRFLRPVAPWLATSVLGVTALLVLRPWLVWVAPAYLLLFAINVGYALRRDERSLVNDAVFVGECSLMVPITWAVAVSGDGGPPLTGAPAAVWILTVAVAMLLTGSTMHVKSLIRERANPRFATASRAVAISSVAAAVLLAMWWGLPDGLALIVPFAFFAVRAVTMRRPAPRPARIGLIELVGFCLLVTAAAVLA